MSKPKYLAQLLGRTSWDIVGITLVLSTALMFMLAMLCMVMAILSLAFALTICLLWLSGAIVLGAIGGALLYAAYMAFGQSEKVDVGLPFTRATIATLPAPESLVRPSQQPTQTQQSTLLRPAINNDPTAPEHLVRASSTN